MNRTIPLTLPEPVWGRLASIADIQGVRVEEVLAHAVAVELKHARRPADEEYLVIGTVMERAKTQPKNKTAFVVRAIERDPFEFQKLIDEAVAS